MMKCPIPNYALTFALGVLMSSFGLFPGRCIAQEMDLPALAIAGKGGYLGGELIYPLDNTPTPECHASTLLETSDGLLASWFGGTYEKHPDVGIWLARWDGSSWSEPREVANGVQSPDLRYPCWNPVLFQPEGGPIFLYYKVGPSPREWWGMQMTSTDGGKSWSAPEKLGSSPEIGHLIGPVKNKAVQLEYGKILSPSSTESEGPDGPVWRVHFELSRDFGESWTVIGPINDGIEFDAIQPSILQHANGDLQVLCRSRQGVVTQSWSTDGGLTWSDMTATELPNPNSGTDAVTLSDGRQLLVYNHTLRGGDFPQGRNMLNVALSDDGRHWTPVLTLERQEGEYSYPAVIQALDGLIHISYTYDRRSIKHVILDPDQLGKG